LRTNSLVNTKAKYMELYLPPKSKRDTRKKNWTPEMIRTLTELFPVSYNKVLASQLGVSWRTLLRKARELNLEKEPDFLENRRAEITTMAVKAHPPHPHKGEKGWSIPNSEKNQYKPGNIPAMVTNPEVRIRVHKTRSATIKRDRIRIKLGLSRLTKFNLKPI